MIIVVFLLAVASMLTVNWLRRPVTGRTLTGESFQLTGHDALLQCVMTNDADSLQRLLMMDTYDLDRSKKGEWTLMQHALHHGCVSTTTVLLENGADPNAASDGTPTPLELARRNGHPDLIDVLTRFGAEEY
jgi:ankyrin repeat protein